MNHSLRFGLIAFAAGILVPFTLGETAIAATFGQKAVDQEKFVAVAVPRSNNYYNLLIIEQISSQRACWRESGSQPTQIDPLLQNFDFSGICGRSTDSNGYSLRMAGKDLGLSYRLRLQQGRNELVLMGIPDSSRMGHPVEIGRTQGMGPGFLKIHLNSGWQFAKRTYQGQALGHVYLATNTPQSSSPPLASLSTANRSTLPKKTITISSVPKPASGSFSSAIDIPVPEPGSDYSSTLSAARSSIVPSSNTAYRVIVQTRSSREQSKVRAIAPDAFRTSYGGKTVMQAGLFQTEAKAEEMHRRLKRAGLKSVLIESKVSQLPTNRNTTTSTSYSLGNATALAVPGGRIPLGNTRGDSDVYSALPPPPPSSEFLLGPRYRVVVLPQSSRQQAQIRSLVPDAFRSFYQGRRVIQVGSFATQGEAQERMQLMQRNGLNPIMERTQ